MQLKGRFGPFGGIYVSELLIPALEELEEAWLQLREDPSFTEELDHLLQGYAGRPTALYHSLALSHAVGCQVYLKREDLLHGGAHKINNTLGQGLLARRMKKRELIAETGAGQHGVATAMTGALLGLKTTIFMGSEDIRRQAPNVQRMQLFGAEVRSVDSGSRCLKDAINEALRYWTEHVEESFYLFGTVAGPHPYPLIVRGFQKIIGEEIAKDILKWKGRLPTAIFACVGGGSNAIGAFATFIDNQEVRLIGVEAGGMGLESGRHGATLLKGRRGSLHGAISYVLQDEHGQICEAHSISAGLDYPGVGPEHAQLKESGRASYEAVEDQEALQAFCWLARQEGILPALESAHAIAALLRYRGGFQADDIVVVNLSGRGDKDLAYVMELLQRDTREKTEGKNNGRTDDKKNK